MRFGLACLLAVAACTGPSSVRIEPPAPEHARNDGGEAAQAGPACTEPRVIGHLGKVWDDGLALDPQHAFIRVYAVPNNPEAEGYSHLIDKPQPHGIWSMALGDGHVERVWSGATGILGIGIAMHGGDLVTWSHAGGDLTDATHPHGAIVWRVSASGGPLVRIATSPNECAAYGGLAVVDDFVYFAHIGCDFGPGTFARAPLAGGAVEVLWTGSDKHVGVHDFAIARGVAYLVVGGDISTLRAVDLASPSDPPRAVYDGVVRAVGADDSGVFVATASEVLRVNTSPAEHVADVARARAITLTPTGIYAATDHGLVRIPRAGAKRSTETLFADARAGRAVVVGRNVYWVAGSPPMPGPDAQVVTAECR